MGAIEEFKQFSDAMEARFSEVGGDVGVLKAQLLELEQKMARRGPSGPYRPPTPGQQFVSNDEVKNFIGNARAGRRLTVEMKAILTSATTDADGSAGDLLQPFRDVTYVGPKRNLTVRSLLPVVQVSQGGSVEYAKQTGFTINAATVAEGASKPQSEIKYDLVQVPIRTIAHFVLASRQILDDAPQLMGLIDTELRYGLSYVEDLALLSGAGTGTELNGIYTQATAFASPFGSVLASATKLDVIGAALLQNALADEPATGVVMHPSDWTDIRLLKDGEGRYIMGPPGADVEPRLFGLPVVPTKAMSVDKFLVGNFEAATLYDRWEARVEVSTEDSDNFRKNLVTLLAEERIGLAVKNAAAFTKGDFSDAITDLMS